MSAMVWQNTRHTHTHKEMNLYRVKKNWRSECKSIVLISVSYPITCHFLPLFSTSRSTFHSISLLPSSFLRLRASCILFVSASIPEQIAFNGNKLMIRNQSANRKKMKSTVATAKQKERTLIQFDLMLLFDMM